MITTLTFFGLDMERSLRPKTDKDFGAPPPGYVAGRGRGATGFASGVSRDFRGKQDDEKESDLGDSGYDKFSGYSESLFQSGTFDKEDDEADRIYDLIENRMESRRKRPRGSQTQPSGESSRAEIPDLQSQFSDLKSELSRVSEEDWMQLPVAQERLKVKKAQKEVYSNAPDSVINPANKPPGMLGSITEVGEAKKAVLSVSLGSTEGLSVDPRDYLNELETRASAVADIAEVKKARLLFKSLTKSDPSNPTAWIAAARLEEVSGEIQEAKSIIARGLAECPTSEDLWMAAIRLEHNKEKSKSIVANAIRQLPKSVALWRTAAEIETKSELKSRVFQKALEVNPDSVVLWKDLVNLTSTRSDALLLLARAVECCPTSEELWLKYAKLSDGQTAQRILNDARRAIPTSLLVWIAAADLAESMGAENPVLDNIVSKAIDSLQKNGVHLERRAWLDKAIASEGPRTGASIARVVVRNWVIASVGMRSSKELKHELFSDLEYVVDQSGESLDPNRARVGISILECAVTDTPLRERKGIWIKLIRLVQSTKGASQEKILDLYRGAVDACPQSEVLWLMYAKYLWSDLCRLDMARSVMQKAMEVIEDSEDIYIAAAKIEENVSLDGTRNVLAIARNHCPKSCRLWIKSAQVERSMRNADGVLSLCQDALGRVSLKNPDLFKLHIIPVHAFIEAGRLDEASELAARACETLPQKSPVWLVSADIAIEQNDLNRARSILERARIRIPNDENLWWKGFCVEELSHGSTSAAVKVFLSRALQACPTSGLLWTCAISAEPPITRHPKCLDALKKCPNDGLVVAAVAKFFWLEKKQIDKARKWFLNASTMGPRLGQVWVDFLSFEASQGDDNLFNTDHVVGLIKALDQTTVNHGIEWNMFRKSIANWKKSLFELIYEFAQSKYPNIMDNLSDRTARLLSQTLSESVKVDQTGTKSE